MADRIFTKYGQINNKKEYDDFINMKMMQYDMYRNTLDEMHSKGIEWIIGHQSQVKMVQNEMDTTMKEIESIKGEFANHKWADDNVASNVTYSFYDKVKKDSSEWDEKKHKPCGANCICHSVNTKPSEGVTTTASTYFFDEINKNAENMASSNNFIVDIMTPLGIPSTMVRNVSYNNKEKQIVLTIYDFVGGIGDRKFPVIDVLEDSFNYNYKWEFSIKHLKTYGDLLYKEKYSGCKVVNVLKGPLDYSVSDFSIIEIVISYDRVEYETSEQEGK